MMAVLAMLGLVLDGGLILSRRRMMQNAADAGALAGAWELAPGGTDSEVNSRIQEYAVTRNGATSFTATYEPDGTAVGSGSIPPGTEGVAVEAQITNQTVIAGIIGIDQLTVGANATASYGSVAEMTQGVYPIGVEWEDFLFGQTYDLFDSDAPGNFGWLSWTGCTNVPCLCTSLTPPGDSETYVNPNDPGDHTLSIGDWVESGPGTKNSQCIRAQLDDFIANETPITVVVWDQVQGGGANAEYRIAGFAMFIMEARDLPNKTITGHFVQKVVPVTSIQGGADYGVYGVTITE